jgi:FtsH-binding integral membrane protein
MADYDNRVRSVNAAAGAVAVDEGLRAYMLRVYNYMLMGLALTGASAWAVLNIPALQALFFQVGATGIALSPLGWIALFAPLGLVFFLSFRIHHMSLSTAQTVFWIYAGINGIAFAPIVYMYTAASVAQVFFITAATFGAMSLWGYTTKRDLTGVGSFLFMGLIGIIIASVVNLFMQSGTMQLVISIIGVIVFTGLTAYDTQRIKEEYDVVGHDGTLAGKGAVMGALRLYLDFINLFLMLLRLLGDRR